MDRSVRPRTLISRMFSFRPAFLLVVVALGSCLVGNVQATTTIATGFNLFHTTPGSTFYFPPPVPNNQFVDFVGVPLGTFDFGGGAVNVGTTDTIIERTQIANLGGGADTIDIEIVALSMVSTVPVDLGFGAGFEDIFIDFNTSSPTTQSTMTIFDDGEGQPHGTFNSTLNFTFDVVGSVGGFYATLEKTIDATTQTWQHEPTGSLLIGGVNYLLNALNETNDYWPSGLVIHDDGAGTAIHITTAANHSGGGGGGPGGPGGGGTIQWVGGDGIWYVGTGSWYSVGASGTGSAFSEFGRDNGWEAGGPTYAVIGAGNTVYYNSDTVGEFRWEAKSNAGAGSITVRDGATLNMETNVKIDGVSMQFDAERFTVSGPGSLFNRFNSGTALNGGALIFGSERGYADAAGQNIEVGVFDGGEIRNKGQTWFGAYGDEELLNATLTIGENAKFSNDGALENGVSLDDSAGAGNEGEFNFIYTAPDAGGPHAHNYAWNFTGHNGEVNLGAEGVRVQVQDGGGVWSSLQVTYEEMYEGVATGKSADDALLSYEGNNGNNSSAVFADYFEVTPGITGGQDLRSIAGILQGGSVAGDLNEDGFRDAVDFGIIAGNFGSPGPHATKDGDINWTAASGTGGDDLIDAADIGVLFGNWTGDHLPVGPGTASAHYDSATGEIDIEVNGVVNFYVEQVGGAAMTGDAPTGLNPAYGLITNNDVRIGQSGFAPFSYDVSLGNVAATGLSCYDFRIFWNATLGGELQSAELCIPEPTTLALTGLALCGVLATRRRRVA